MKIRAVHIGALLLAIGLATTAACSSDATSVSPSPTATPQPTPVEAGSEPNEEPTSAPVQRPTASPPLAETTNDPIQEPTSSTPLQRPAVSPSATETVDEPNEEPSPTPTEAARTPVPTSTPLKVSFGGVAAISEKQLQKELRAADFSSAGWKSNFHIRIVPYEEVLSGGPPKDGIPAIDNPKFVSVDEASQWMVDVEPVQVVNINGDARAYPIQIMIWHEIVNDTVGGEPVAITY